MMGTQFFLKSKAMQFNVDKCKNKNYFCFHLTISKKILFRIIYRKILINP